MKQAHHSPVAFRPFDEASISNLEAKRDVAERLAAGVEPGQVIGAGSGSTAYLAVLAIAERHRRGEIDGVKLIPTSIEVHLTIAAAGLAVGDLASDRPQWLFDGADEVDPGGNLIKGRGGALFREKLLFSATEDRRVLVDSSKMVERLGTKFAVPVEVVPAALPSALPALRDLGAAEAEIRTGSGKDGPVVTEYGNVLVDCRFERIGDGLEADVKSIVGVLDSGLFQGFRPSLITV